MRFVIRDKDTFPQLQVIHLTNKQCVICCAFVSIFFSDPGSKEQAPVTSGEINKTIERYLAEYAREHLGKPLTTAPNSNCSESFLNGLLKDTEKCCIIESS